MIIKELRSIAKLLNIQDSNQYNKEDLRNLIIKMGSRKFFYLRNSKNWQSGSDTYKIALIDGAARNDGYERRRLKKEEDGVIKMKLNDVYKGDCLDHMKPLADNSVDLCLTDPPYFLDKLDDTWNKEVVDSKKYQNKGTVRSLPAGMKFDRNQGKKFYDFYLRVSKEIMRILKPGGFFLSFSSPRLYHRMACAVDDAGFYVRDQMIWLYTQNQVKAQGMSNFIKKTKGLTQKEKDKYVKEFEGWKTPQIRSNHEPICLAQKSLDGTFLMNQIKHGVGLINCNIKVGNNKFVSNILSSEKIYEEIDSHFLIGKPRKEEKGDYNDHKTVKPLILCQHLISLTTLPEALVFDPFVGSGTTCVAAKLLNRNYIGFDLDENNIKISKRRLEEVS